MIRTGYRLQVTSYRQRGQVIIILLLLMLVALSIGLALTQRSITDVTTSTQAEQSTRAFSAAEAGIEKALSSPLPLGTVIALDNNSSATIGASGLLPYAGTSAAIEYPKIGRETTAQFWFVDPATVGAPTLTYNSSRLELYFGNENTTDLPAVEVNIVMFTNNNFYTDTFYYDSNSARTQPPSGNRFTAVNGTGSENLSVGILGNNRKFFRKQIIGPFVNPATGSGTCCTTAACILILARIRFLYINENHSLALAPLDGGQFPPQIRIYNATGVSGQSQKQIQAFKVEDVVEPWFDFALFSINELRK